MKLYALDFGPPTGAVVILAERRSEATRIWNDLVAEKGMDSSAFVSDADWVEQNPRLGLVLHFFGTELPPKVVMCWKCGIEIDRGNSCIRCGAGPRGDVS
jgi:hypothetical protein